MYTLANNCKIYNQVLICCSVIIKYFSSYYKHIQSSLQRVERELHTLERDSIGLTPQILVQHLAEEVTVQSAIVKEKLPSELNAKKNRMRALSIVKEYPYLGPDKIVTMRNDLDVILKDIQDLVESKVCNQE